MGVSASFGGKGGASVDTVETTTVSSTALAWGSVVLASSASAITTTLPTATAADVGKKITVRAVGAGGVTVAPAAGDSLAGQTVLAQNAAVTYEVTAAGAVVTVQDVASAMTETPLSRTTVFDGNWNVATLGGAAGVTFTPTNTGMYAVRVGGSGWSTATTQQTFNIVLRQAAAVLQTIPLVFYFNVTSSHAYVGERVFYAQLTGGVQYNVGATTAGSGVLDAADRWHIELEQLPTATTVNPSTVPVQSLNHATGSRSTAQAFTTAATAAVPQAVLFNAHTSLSGTITLNAATGELTLPAGTYKVAGGLGSANAPARTFWRWYVNGVGGGAFGGGFSPTDTAGNAQLAGPAHHEFTCPAGTLLKLGVVQTTANVTYGGQIDTPLAFPWYAIEQMATATVIFPGTTPVITDTTLALGNNTNVPSSTAIKTYVDMRLATPVVQTFTAGGTYTPTTGMKWCEVEAVGGGGGSGGCGAGTTNNLTLGGAGGAGAYAKVILTAAQVGGSQVVTIGAAGAAGAATPTAGAAGGTTSFGALFSCPGGAGGVLGAAATAGYASVAGGFGGAAPTVTTGTVVAARAGENGERGHGATGTNNAQASTGAGGSTPFGRGGADRGASHANVSASFGGGIVGVGNGAGASGSYSSGVGATAQAGAAGTIGLVRVVEHF